MDDRTFDRFTRELIAIRNQRPDVPLRHKFMIRTEMPARSHDGRRADTSSAGSNRMAMSRGGEQNVFAGALVRR